jgi:low affinity Fe/Cu permease
MNDFFHKVAVKVSNITGSAWTFITALIIITVWAISGPVFGFSDTWQLIINTSTTIITFLMVFLIQNTQNRDARAIHIKLDELIRGVKGARNSLVDLENLSEEEIRKYETEFKKLHTKYISLSQKRKTKRSKKSA